MAAVLAFALTLLLAVLLSELADRTVLSTAVLFLAAGAAIGGPGLGLFRPGADDPVIGGLAELALVSVLYTDGMRAGLADLRRAYRLPGRALLLGLPLTLLLTALLARLVVGLPWAEALLIGAVLSPTDPVFAAAIVGREEVPGRLRFLLNVESGLNDGLALPLVVAMLGVLGSAGEGAASLLGELILGVVLGVAIPWAALRLERSRYFAAASAYEPLLGFAIGLLVFAAAKVTGGNEFLAVFAAGVTVATAGPAVRSSFHGFGETLTELLKLAALFVFGALVSRELLRGIRPADLAFAVLTLAVPRSLALGVALWGSDLDWRERVTAAWFGPKGFASVVYGLMILRSGLPGSELLFSLVTLVIAGSIVAHSSTDVLVARWFRGDESEPGVARGGEEPRPLAAGGDGPGGGGPGLGASDPPASAPGP